MSADPKETIDLLLDPVAWGHVDADGQVRICRAVVRVIHSQPEAERPALRAYADGLAASLATHAPMSAEESAECERLRAEIAAKLRGMS